MYDCPRSTGYKDNTTQGLVALSLDSRSTVQKAAAAAFRRATYHEQQADYHKAEATRELKEAHEFQKKADSITLLRKLTAVAHAEELQSHGVRTANVEQLNTGFSTFDRGQKLTAKQLKHLDMQHGSRCIEVADILEENPFLLNIRDGCQETLTAKIDDWITSVEVAQKSATGVSTESRLEESLQQHRRRTRPAVEEPASLFSNPTVVSPRNPKPLLPSFELRELHSRSQPKRKSKGKKPVSYRVSIDEGDDSVLE